jgi:hypothetical protein
MKTFLQRFSGIVLGVLSGFDRVVFKGRLPQLYSPEGMNCYASANHVKFLDFKVRERPEVGVERLTESGPGGGVVWSSTGGRGRVSTTFGESKPVVAFAAGSWNLAENTEDSSLSGERSKPGRLVGNAGSTSSQPGNPDLLGGLKSSRETKK